MNAGRVVVPSARHCGTSGFWCAAGDFFSPDAAEYSRVASTASTAISAWL